MAEWLCSGLQSRLRRFDSGFSLQNKETLLNLKMKISIITTFFNAEKHILDCLLSVQKIPDHINYEHILVNDGSDDGSVEIASKNLSSHQMIIGQDRIGRGNALNHGIQNAIGDFICILDSDDLINHKWIEYFATCLPTEYLNEYELAVFYSNSFVSNNDLIKQNSDVPKQNILDSDLSYLNSKLLLFYNPIPHLGAMIKKSALTKVQNYSTNRDSQFDWDLWLRFSAQNMKFLKVNIFSGIKRVHENQYYEHGNHLLYALKGIKLQLHHSFVHSKLLLIPVAIFSIIRFFWALFPKKVRISHKFS